MADEPKPKKPRPQGVFLLAIKIAGDPAHCRRFARAIADAAEAEFTAHERKTKWKMKIGFDVNLCKWEKL